MVKNWLDRSDAELDWNSTHYLYTGDMLDLFGWLLVFLSVVFAVVFAFIIGGNVNEDEYSPWLWAVPLVCLMAGIIMCCIHNNRYNEVAKAYRIKLERERQSNPMYVRAKTLIEATDNYLIHRDRYMAWCLAVEAGVQEEDKEAAERYLAFLQRAYSVLNRAMINFENLLELFARWHGHKTVAEPQDAALSDLLARLDQPTEIPSLPVVPDLRRVLEYEDALVELNEELASQEFCLQRQ